MVRKTPQKRQVIAKPTVEQLEKQLRVERERIRYRYALSTTICMLMGIAATAYLIATLWLPVLRVFGNSMAPTLNEGEVIVAAKSSEYEQGDIVAFYSGNNKLLIKRIIASSGDWIDIDDAGNVTVNGTALEEPYVSQKALGECDIDLPCQVPDGKHFVMGDNREASIDSRSSSVGFISNEDVAGKLTLRVWPLSEVGQIESER